MLAVLTFTSFFCSCSAEKTIEEICIGDKKYETIYLYSFEDANINDTYYFVDNSDIIPTTSGYAYFSQKLSSGDPVQVWTNCYFQSGDSWAFGTKAVVEQLIDIYPIKVKEQQDCYVITYYEVEDVEHSVASDKQNLSKITKNEIKCAKELVIIRYNSK